MIYLFVYLFVLVALMFWATRNPLGAMLGLVASMWALIFVITRG